MQYYRRYVYGSHFILVTDHSALRYIHSYKHTNDRLLRWSLKMQDYTFSVEHKPGVEHVDADALTRMPVAYVASQQAEDSENESLTGEPNAACAASSAHRTCEPTLDLPSIRLAQQTDAFLSSVYFYLRDGRLPADQHAKRTVLARAKRFALRDDALYRVVSFLGSHVYLLALPPSFTRAALLISHDHPLAGHLGHRRTLDRVRQRFWWPNMEKDVRDGTRACRVCQRVKPGPHGPFPLMSIPVGGPMYRVAMDIGGPFPPTAAGNKYLLLFVDHYSQWSQAYAMATQDAETVARLFLEGIVCIHGCPQHILSDRGAQFMSDVIKHLCRLLSVTQNRTCAYHPQCNGRAERSVQTLARRSTG